MTTTICRRLPKRIARVVALASAVAGLAACAGASGRLVPVEDGRLVMGTVLDLSLLVPPGREDDAREALGAAFETAEALERLTSRHDPASQLSALNAAAGRGGIEIDPRLYELLRLSEAARTRTHGAFDVTVGPLVALWTEAARRDRTPAPDELRRARARVGRPLWLAPPFEAALTVEGMSLDLGGVAKGFAIDRIAAELAGRGLPLSLLSFGRSSVWAGGRSWRLRIESDQGEALAVVELADQALSMSSSLSQSTVIEGVEYGHVVDPRSGRALCERRSAVVVADRAVDAEVLSTALLVLDEREGRAVLREAGAEAWVRRADGIGWQSAGWRRATRFQAISDGS